MARITEAAPNTFALWKKILSWGYRASVHPASLFLSVFPDTARLTLCIVNAVDFKPRSSWLNSTPLPNDCYLSPFVTRLFQPLYVLAVLAAVLFPLCTVAFWVTMFRRETTYAGAILVIAVITISTAVAAIVLALQTLIQPSLDMQAILRIRPDLTSEDVLTDWDNFMGLGMPLGVFILYLFTGGFQVVAVSVRHLIPSPKRLPKQLHPFVMKKHKRKSAIGEPEASTLGTELVAGVDSGPLAKLLDDYERRGILPTHTDLESFRSEDHTRPRADEERDAFFNFVPFPVFQEVDTLFNTLTKDDRTEDGPQFTLSDRYWVVQSRGFCLRILILASALCFVVTISFETVRFAIARSSTQADQWLYILGIIYPWQFVILIVPVLISVHYRFGLQRKVLGRIRVDLLLFTGFIIALLLTAVHGIAKCVSDFSHGDSNAVFVIWDLIKTVLSFMTLLSILAFFWF